MITMKNELSELHIKLPKEALEYKEKRVSELLKDSKVIAFLETHQLPDDFVSKHFSYFERWIAVKNNQPSVKEYQRPGYDLELIYQDGFLDYAYIQSKEDALYQQQMAHLNYFRINHVPSPMKEVSFKTIAYEQETSFYITVASQIKQLINNNKGQGFYLHGSIGSGKTYLMACLSNDLARQKKSVSFVRMNELLGELKSFFNDTTSTNEIMDGLMTSYCLVIDDIGAENVSAWGRDEILFNVLNYRMENQLLTCFTSNLSMKELKDVYLKQQYGVVDENKVNRLMERILTLAKPLTLYGDSRRKY